MTAARRVRPLAPMTLHVALAVLAAAALATAVFAAAGASPVRAGTSHSVDIANFAFSPQTLTIQVGDTVTWTNLDTVQHTATSTSGAFDTGLLDQNEGYSITFTQPGTFDYLCTPHPSMTGQIVVQGAPAATPAPSQATGGGGTIPDVAMPAPAATDPAMLAGISLVLLALLPGLVLLRRRRQD
jgi:amicyanin